MPRKNVRWTLVTRIRSKGQRSSGVTFLRTQHVSIIKEKLREADIQWTSVADTGILAVIPGEKGSERVVALRADMDALPIVEENKIDYRSRNAGVMYACGHDAHTSSLLGTSQILQRLKSKFGGYRVPRDAFVAYWQDWYSKRKIYGFDG